MKKIRDFFERNRVVIVRLLTYLIVAGVSVLVYKFFLQPFFGLLRPPMGIEYSRNLGDLVKGVAWPLVTLLGIVVLRQPITRFLEQIAGRASKFSVFKLEIELGDVAPLQAMNLPSLDDIQTPNATAWTSDSSGNLFQQIMDARMADYAVIDLEDGKEWLSSRIFIFAVMLERMRGLRHIVFLYTNNGKRRSFLGITKPNKIHWIFAQKYPWLELAFASAYQQFAMQQVNQANAYPHPIFLSDNGAVDPVYATTLVSNFLALLQLPHSPIQFPGGMDEWVELDPARWEHASWVDNLLLSEILDKNLINAPVEFSFDVPAQEQAKRVLRRNGEFVALVDKDEKFASVVNRAALVEKLAVMAGTVEKL